MLLQLYNDGHLQSVRRVLVEPEYGRTARIEYHTGAVRFVYNNDVGLNSAAACELDTDKAYTKWLLEELGYRVPKGQTFVMPWYEALISESLQRRGFGNLKTVTDLIAYADRTKYPVYVKPVDGSKGRHVHRCDKSAEVVALVDDFERHHIRVMLVEDAVMWPDYRLVILKDELISAYERNPLMVTGDGVSSVNELLLALQEHFAAIGRDTRVDIRDSRIDARLLRLGLSRAHVLRRAQRIYLLDISNLSTGGRATEVTERVAPGWVQIGRRIARDMAMSLCGLDIACSDITKETSEYAILEVNATPGLDHYAAVGAVQEATVRSLYQRVFDAAPT
jgi:D-alanine-D-alanine ligase-like ATP-grasp enzyme